MAYYLHLQHCCCISDQNNFPSVQLNSYILEILVHHQVSLKKRKILKRMVIFSKTFPFMAKTFPFMDFKSFQTINFFIKKVCILKKVHLFWSTTAKFCPMSFTATFEANLFPCFRWQFKTCLTPPSSSLLDSYWCLFQTTNISLLP